MMRMRSGGELRSWVLWASAAWFAAIPARAPAAGLDGFAGTWVRTERAADDATRDTAILHATEPMSFAFRGFARGVMRRRMVPPERYEVAQGAEAAWIRNDKGEVFLI